MKPVCLVIGAGAGIGGNVGRRFAREGYHAVLCRRSDAEGLRHLVESIEKEGSPREITGAPGGIRTPDPQVRRTKGPQAMTRGCVSLLCSVRHAAAQSGTGDGNGTPAAPIGGRSSDNPPSTAHARRVIDLDAYTLAAIRP